MKLGWMFMGTDEKFWKVNWPHIKETILDKYPEDVVVIYKNSKGLKEKDIKNVYYIETNINPGPHYGAANAINVVTNLIKQHKDLNSADYWVYSNFDVFIKDVEAHRKLCKTMKEDKKIFASFFRLINKQLNEPIAPLTDWFVFNTNWGITSNILKTLTAEDAKIWAPNKIGPEGTELAIFRTFLEEQARILPFNIWAQVFLKPNIMREHDLIKDLGLQEYRKETQYFLHHHDLNYVKQRLEQWKKSY